MFSYILDDRIFCSWCLFVLNIQFNISYCIQCFDQNFERLSPSNLNSETSGIKVLEPKAEKGGDDIESPDDVINC